MSTVSFEHLSPYCSRCGTETCFDGYESACSSLAEFAAVTTVAPLDGPAGQSLFRFKRYGSPEHGIEFATGLLPALVAAVEQLVVDHEVSCIVVLPFSRQSFMSGKMHPNLVIFDALRARFGASRSPLAGGRIPIGCGMHAGRSRSLQRRRAFHQPRKSFRVGRASAAAVKETWVFDSVRWLTAGKVPFAQTIQNESGSSALFIDDVLSSGYTAARFAAVLDPECRRKWLLAAAARTVYRDVTLRRMPSF